MHANNGTADLPGDGQGTDIATVGRGAIAIQTQVSPGSITIGSTFNDTATLTKPTIGPLPTGTVSFDVYSNPTCTGTPIFTSTNPVSAAGTSAVSNNFTAAAAGTYQVIARYSGDANWADLASRCDDPAATVAVSRATPSLATRPSAAVVLGAGALTDSATLTGLVNPQPGATVTFLLYGPDDASRSAAAVQLDRGCSRCRRPRDVGGLHAAAGRDLPLGRVLRRGREQHAGGGRLQRPEREHGRQRSAAAGAARSAAAGAVRGSAGDDRRTGWPAHGRRTRRVAT